MLLFYDLSLYTKNIVKTPFFFFLDCYSTQSLVFSAKIAQSARRLIFLMVAGKSSNRSFFFFCRPVKFSLCYSKSYFYTLHHLWYARIFFNRFKIVCLSCFLVFHLWVAIFVKFSCKLAHCGILARGRKLFGSDYFFNHFPYKLLFRKVVI